MTNLKNINGINNLVNELQHAAELANISLKETVQYRDEVLHVFSTYWHALESVRVLPLKESSNHVKTTLASFSENLDDLKTKLNNLATYISHFTMSRTDYL